MINNHVRRALDTVRLLTTVVFGVVVVALVPSTGAMAAPEPVVKYYVVPEPKAGAKVESLADIAGRFLGNRNCAPDIVKLNAELVQRDGTTLGKTGVVKPGYVLQLPENARGVGVRVGQLSKALTPPPPNRQAPPPSTAKPSTAQPQPTTAKPAQPKPTPPKPRTAAQESQDEEETGFPTVEMLLGLGTLAMAAAGRVAWLWFRRSRETSAHAATVDPDEYGYATGYEDSGGYAVSCSYEDSGGYEASDGYEHHEVSLGSALIDVRFEVSTASAIHYLQSADLDEGICLGQNEDGFLHLDPGKVQGVIVVNGDRASADQLAEMMLQDLELDATIIGAIAQDAEAPTSIARIDRIAEFDPPRPGGAPQLVLWEPNAPVRAQEVEFLTAYNLGSVIPVVLGEVPDAPMCLTITPVESSGRHASATAQRVPV